MLKQLLNKLLGRCSNSRKAFLGKPTHLRSQKMLVVEPLLGKPNENLIPIEGDPNHFLVAGTSRSGKRILDPVMSMNPISKFGLAPDETLIMLSKVCNYRLTDEQVSIAKLSGMELLSSATIDEITILDLVNLCQDTPALSDFADSLRKSLLPS